MIPSGMVATNIAANASSKVADRRSAIAAVTGWFVRSDVPRLPVPTPFRNAAYYT